MHRNSAPGALKRGTVYVTLGRLEAKGLIESEQEAPRLGAIGLPRRIYRITGLGEGVDTPLHKFWGFGTSILKNTGDTARIRTYDHLIGDRFIASE